MAKIGEGHLSAAGRQGLAELRAALYPDSNIVRNTESGLYGTKTPGEVADARRNHELDLNEQPGATGSGNQQRATSSKDGGIPSQSPTIDMDLG